VTLIVSDKDTERLNHRDTDMQRYMHTDEKKTVTSGCARL